MCFDIFDYKFIFDIFQKPTIFILPYNAFLNKASKEGYKRILEVILGLKL